MKTKSLQNNNLYKKRMKYYNDLEKKTLKITKGKIQYEFINIAQKLLLSGEDSFTVSQLRRIGNFKTKPNYIITKHKEWFKQISKGVWTLSDELKPDSKYCYF